MPTIIELCKDQIIQAKKYDNKRPTCKHMLHSFHGQNSPSYLLPANIHENGCQKIAYMKQFAYFTFLFMFYYLVLK